MSENKKKKLFPKLKKQLSDFLTDESWEITKKDALGISAGAVLLTGVESVDAGHWNYYSPSLPSYNWAQVVTVSDMTCSHVSGVVNWHVSQVPKVNYRNTIHTHSSWHSSHGSGGWC